MIRAKMKKCIVSQRKNTKTQSTILLLQQHKEPSNYRDQIY